MLQKIKLKIIKQIENKFYNYAFHNQPILIRVFYEFYRPDDIYPPFPLDIQNITTRLTEDEENQEETDEEDEEENEEKQINTTKSRKSDECVICLTNLPNVLFCNCGHIPICVECEEVKSLVVCPVCKTENTIKRIIEIKIFFSPSG